jgi:hypothetical protein
MNHSNRHQQHNSRTNVGLVFHMHTSVRRPYPSPIQDEQKLENCNAFIHGFHFCLHWSSLYIFIIPMSAIPLPVDLQHA